MGKIQHVIDQAHFTVDEFPGHVHDCLNIFHWYSFNQSLQLCLALSVITHGIYFLRRMTSQAVFADYEFRCKDQRVEF
jgi:hypothetical protein